MCDYSVSATRKMDATVGQKLVSTNFTGGSTGFTPKGSSRDTAVCLLPGTELAFTADVVIGPKNFGRVARFRQIEKDRVSIHHDQLEFANGDKFMLGYLPHGYEAEVLQLPAKPKTVAEHKELERAVYAS